MTSPPDPDRRTLDEALFGEFRVPSFEVPESMVGCPPIEPEPLPAPLYFPVIEQAPELDDEPELPLEGYLHRETAHLSPEPSDEEIPLCSLETIEPLTLAPGETTVLTRDHLRVTGREPALIDLMLLSPCEQGTLRRDGVALTGGDVFTQDDIDRGRIYYCHGGKSASDGFTFATPDGEIQAVFAIVIERLRRAPELFGAGDLTNVLDSCTVTQLLAGQAHTHDPDVPPGVALVRTKGRGCWYVSRDGERTWLAMEEVRPSNCLLLGANDALRFVPSPGWAGTVELTYRAWDGSSGEAGHVFDLSVREAVGGTAAFSKATATARFVLPPTLPPLPASPPWESTSTVEELFGDGAALVRLEGPGTWQVSLEDEPNWRTPERVYHGRALLLRASDRVRFVPKKGASGKVVVGGRVWDGSGPAGETATLAARGSYGEGTAFGEFVATRTWWLVAEQITDESPPV